MSEREDRRMELVIAPNDPWRGGMTIVDPFCCSLFVAMVLFSSMSTAATSSEQAIAVEEAQSALEAKRYDEALRLYKQAAQTGSAVAMFQIGSMYEHGNGVTPNREEAANWYKRAAQAGAVPAMKR